MSSAIEDAHENPSSKLPYELLSKIFIHCLPLHPLTEPQPNTKIAPMLLCHVCSSWRDVALTCTPIWSHLFFKLPILWDPREGHPIVWDSKALIGDIECLRWWRKNQGSIPPSIHFDPRQRTRGRLSDATHQDSRLDGDSENFLLDYISSAQYLDVHLFYRYLTARRQATHSGPNPMCPNLHTLITEYSYHITRRYSSMTEGIPDRLPFVPLRIPPTLRCLSLFNIEEEPEWINNLSNWATLTHLSLNIQCTVHEWFSIIHAIPNLQRCHFCIQLMDEDITSYFQPTKIVLPRLLKLYLYCASNDNEPLHFPMCALFQNLEFPALQDLHISGENTWWNSSAAVEIRASLRCAPVISKLTLGWDLLVFEDDSDLIPRPTGTDDAPLSSFAPLLTHLQLELECPTTLSDMGSQAERLVQEILCSRLWLYLENPANTIRKVTIVIEQPTDTNFEDRPKDILLSAILKSANKPANVAFEVTSQPRLEPWSTSTDTLCNLMS
ncbi:hypothetical protein BJ912DRAFT_988752 [Pholiota molesta]|nr:hypothetical protein BJ912DRAFT_988752 [Pholiota molesta]